MPTVNVMIDGAARAMNCLADRMGGMVRMVNPDVYREFAYVSCSAYSLFLPKREEVVARETDGFRPLVLVHGLGANRGTWTLLRLYLRLLGRKRVYAFGFEGGDVEDIASRLRDFVEDVRRVTGEEQVDIVAHSLGGILSRIAIQRLGLGGAVRSLLTLATPHQGTYAAFYANTNLTRPLRPESDLIRDLNADDLSERPWRFIAIYSDRDIYVVPKESMTHPNAENILVPCVSHTQYLVSPRIFRKVAELLNSAG